MNCPICGSPVKNEKTSIKRTINGHKIWFNNVPSLTCTNMACGQVVLEGDSIELMRQLIHKVKQLDIQSNHHFSNSTIDFLQIKEVLDEISITI